MVGGMGHTGGLTNPHPWCGRCRAGFSNTGGPPLPRKRAPLQKKELNEKYFEHTKFWLSLRQPSARTFRDTEGKVCLCHFSRRLPTWEHQAC